ncbi:MAG TPA: bifunctional UDP-N-acetylglucosamine diphosphorylase/glucosamine-1-phosphate N-acetyltransferase GlmU [Actinobacteria bacterium]|nr:bifunctional UDP-N-acetylglucosamine diphosphorylase/glucosamine-1-phosphate N-acetyltransferase GlmU [Actinomycetota bacterium]
MDFSKDLSIIILAAGKGKRMKSEIPKVLHRICGKPLIYHILKQVISLEPKNVFIIIGHKKKIVREYLDSNFPSVKAIDQDRQSGTGHAVMMASDDFSGMGKNILILSGDSPLITAGTLTSLVKLRSENDLSVSILTSITQDPAGYGRIIKDGDGKVLKIAEEADASREERLITEVNSSIYCFEKDHLRENIDNINIKNSQGEYYLTDIVEMLINKGERAETFVISDHQEARGINDRSQLSEAEDMLSHRINKKHMENGITIRNPSSVYIEDTVQIKPDTIIEASCFLRGNTMIGKGCSIGPFSQIDDTKIGPRTTVNSSVIIGAGIGPENNIGPYSYIRPGTITGEKVKIGAFCEIKKSNIDEGSKVPHLSYVGDTEIGKGVNIGASSITVNYNGFSKSRTIIEDGAFIGSDTMLVAPVRIGRGAIVAAGSVITGDVPDNALAIERAKQKNIKNGAVKYRNRKKMDREK